MVPDFQTLMLPALQLIADGQTHRAVPDIADALATKLGLTEAERQQRLPSGVQTTIVNRTYWVFTYLAKAVIVERPARGRVRITSRGREVLQAAPARIDIAFLRRYPEFEEWRAKTAPTPTLEPGTAAVTQYLDQNPEEHLYATYDALRQTVEAEIIERLQSDTFSWTAFEATVVELLGAMGYGSSTEETSRRVTKRTGDDGIDGVIDEDKLGLDAVYIQAKKYGAATTVGRPALQAFAGSLEGQRAGKGVFITTSRFTSEAEDYVRRISRRIVLIDGPTLARLMYDYGVGVRSRRSLDVKHIDEAYFEGDV
ncbi:MAG: restriction endonuclease [Candidatus Limnocylindrales bacterium]